MAMYYKKPSQEGDKAFLRLLEEAPWLQALILMGEL